MKKGLTRRGFIGRAAALGGAAPAGILRRIGPRPSRQEPLKPLGEAKGIHPGRVVWAYDPQVTDWKGPGDGRWYEGNRVRQERVDGMMSRAVRELAGESTVAKAWDRLFRHLNRSRGKGDAGYKAGERVAVKPNWVGMIWREGAVNAA